MLKRKNKSGIINVASFSAQIPTPLTAVYSASKVYNDFLSKALAIEYEN